MLKFKLEITIKQPVEKVIKIYNDRTSMPQWQPGLLKDEATLDKNHRPIYKLTFRIGRRNMVMTERILHSTAHKHSVLYEMKGVRNTVRNSFTSLGENTLWRSEIEFRFRGVMWLIGPFMKSGFEKQSKIIMNNFKKYVESRPK